MAAFIRTAFFLALLAAAGGGGYLIWSVENAHPFLSYNEFIENLEKGEIRELHISGQEATLEDIYNRQFRVYVPDMNHLLPRLLAGGVVVHGSADYSRLWIMMAISVPLLAIMFVWYLASRKNPREESTGFARDKIFFRGKADRQVTFRDVSGIPEVEDELLELVDFLQKPNKYSKLGAIIPKGVLFQGPPGTGKTLLAKAIAGEAGVPFYGISGSDFVEMFVGVGASRVRELFREAKKNTPCIIFIDEIDAVGGHRAGIGSVGGQEERGQTLNALLVEMDGFASDEKVIVIAATNRPDILDPALLRPGRFDRIITILPPDVRGRKAILDVHTRLVKLSPDVDLEKVALGVPGFTGAELASLVNEAALIAGRSEKEVIEQLDFDLAKDRILMGIERRGLVIDEKDKLAMACHEAGHAIIAWVLPGADPLHKITIIPRGVALGHTQQLPDQDKQVHTRDYLCHRMAVLMGGRAAEEILLQQLSTGAEADIRQVTEIATNMVCRWGMSPHVGPLAFFREDSGFLGGQAAQTIVGRATAHLIDREVRALAEEAYQSAREILEREKDFLSRLTDTLLISETLDREEMQIIYECSMKERKSPRPASGPIAESAPPADRDDGQ